MITVAEIDALIPLLAAVWVVTAIVQGLDGSEIAWHGSRERWDWGVTLGTLARCQAWSRL